MRTADCAAHSTALADPRISIISAVEICQPRVATTLARHHGKARDATWYTKALQSLGARVLGGKVAYVGNHLWGPHEAMAIAMDHCDYQIHAASGAAVPAIREMHGAAQVSAPQGAPPVGLDVDDAGATDAEPDNDEVDDDEDETMVGQETVRQMHNEQTLRSGYLLKRGEKNKVGELASCALTARSGRSGGSCCVHRAWPTTRTRR